MTTQPFIPMVPKFAALLYDGTNSAQILALLDPSGSPALTSETGGVLHFTIMSGYAHLQVQSGRYIVFQMAGGNGYGAPDTAGAAGYSAADLAVNYYAVTPATLPS